MTEKFWDRTATHYDTDIQKHDGNYDTTIQQALSHLTINDDVLDLGCASGEMSLDIAPHVKHLHGIDISAQMIELAKQKAQRRELSNVNFQQLDIFDDSLNAEQFNAVIAFNIIHLLPDIPTALDRLHSLLTPEGLIVSMTPCLGEIASVFKWVIKGAGAIGLAPKIHHLTFADLETTFKHHGFDIVDSQLWDADDRVQWIVARKQ